MEDKGCLFVVVDSRDLRMLWDIVNCCELIGLIPLALRLKHYLNTIINSILFLNSIFTILFNHLPSKYLNNIFPKNPLLEILTIGANI